MTETIDIKWWGDFKFESEQIRAWKLGSLLVRIIKSSNEWQIEYHRPRTQDENEQTWQIIDIKMAFPSPCLLERYLFTNIDSHINLLPRLADRPVVIKPVNPIFIPAGQTGTLFVSTPLWIAGWVDTQKPPLFDMPILRPDDSWFGRDTLQGQICYATNVFGRTQLEHLPARPFRAVTALHVHNKGSHQIQLSRISLPVPSLNLYFSAQTGRLWTSSIEVIHDGKTDMPKVIISNKPPVQAGQTVLLDKPRDAMSESLFSLFEF